MSQNIIVPHFFLFNCYTLMHVYFTSNRSRIRINHLWNCTHKKLTIDRVRFVFNWKIFLSCTAQLGQIPMKSNFTFLYIYYSIIKNLHIFIIIFRDIWCDLQMVSQILFSRIPKCFHQLSPQNWSGKHGLVVFKSIVMISYFLQTSSLMIVLKGTWNFK